MTGRSRKTIGRAEWIEAALRTLVEEGRQAVRVLQLARTLGVSRGSFYWHFKDHADLLASLLAHWEAVRTDAVIERAATASGDARQRFHALLEDVIVHRQGLLEPAVRAWALHDDAAATVVRRVDRKRLKFVTRLYKEMGFSDSEAEARARVAYTFLVGDHVIALEEPTARQQALLDARHALLTDP